MVIMHFYICAELCNAILLCTLNQKITSEKITTIIVTHEIAFAREISDRIVEEGSSEDVIDHPQNPRTKQFLQRFRSNDY